MTSLAQAFSAPFRHLPPGGVPLSPGDMLAACGTAWATWRQGVLAGQEVLEHLGTAVGRMTGCRHAFAFGSGRAGMSVALRAMRALSPDRDVVLLPAFTSYSVAAAVVHAGLRIRLYDLDAETLAPNTGDVAAQLDDAVLCVVVCHLYGYPVRTAELRTLCRAAGAMLLDDAAQAMGARSEDGQAGTTGDVGLFSLARGKNITSVNGGLIVTDDAALAANIASLAPWAAISGSVAPAHADIANDMRLLAKCVALWLFLNPRLYWLPASLPFLGIGTSRFAPDFDIEALRPLQATLASRGVSRLASTNAERGQVAGELEQRARHVGGLRTVRVQPGANPVYLRFPVLPEGGGWPGDAVPEVPRLGMVRSYPESLQDLSPLAPYLLPGPDCPTARWLAATLLTLPTHTRVTESDMDAMMDALASGAGRNRPGAMDAAPQKGGAL